MVMWPLFWFLVYCNTPAFISASEATFGHAESGRIRNTMMQNPGGGGSLEPLALLQAPAPVLQEHLQLGIDFSISAQKVLKSALCSKACYVASGYALDLHLHFPLLLGNTQLAK